MIEGLLAEWLVVKGLFAVSFNFWGGRGRRGGEGCAQRVARIPDALKENWKNVIARIQGKSRVEKSRCIFSCKFNIRFVIETSNFGMNRDYIKKKPLHITIHSGK